MPLPAWMRLGRTNAPAPVLDVWNGEQLPARTIVTDADLHYRIYDQRTGVLLSFGSNGGPGSLNGIALDVLRIQEEHPMAVLYVEQFDGPAYPQGGEQL
jgi:hypothetical protein